MASFLIPLIAADQRQREYNDLMENIIPYVFSQSLHPSSKLPKRCRKMIRKDTSTEHFKFNLDVQQFSPEEITVKVIDERTVCIECKHEEKHDEHGSVSRHFVRKFTLPQGYDIQGLESNLSSDGVLVLTAPKIREEKNNSQYRQIPILKTGEPAKHLQNEGKTGDEEKDDQTKNLQ